MSPNYFPDESLRGLYNDLSLIMEAIAAGHPDTGAKIAHALLEGIQGRLSEIEGPKYATYPQRKYLSILTGWSMYPPSYWQTMGLLAEEVSDFINELKLEGTATLRGVEYRRSEKSKTAPRVTAQDRKRKRALCAVR